MYASAASYTHATVGATQRAPHHINQAGDSWYCSTWTSQYCLNRMTEIDEIGAMKDVPIDDEYEYHRADGRPAVRD